jgi:hypothetical protein
MLLRSVAYNVYPVCNFSENVDFRPLGNYGGSIRTKFVKLGFIDSLMSKPFSTDR